MEKYRKVEKTRESSPEEEIRVTVSGKVVNYVTYAARLFNELNHNTIIVRATGRAITTAVNVVEVVKRRFKGLHQVTTVGHTSIIDEFEPVEEGLDRVKEERQVAYISILLSREEDRIKRDAPGYQEPLDESLVKELDHEAVARNYGGRSRARGGRGARGGGGERGAGTGAGAGTGTGTGPGTGTGTGPVTGGGGYPNSRGTRGGGRGGSRGGGHPSYPVYDNGDVIRSGRGGYRRGGRGRGRGMGNRGRGANASDGPSPMEGSVQGSPMGAKPQVNTSSGPVPDLTSSTT